LRYFKNTKKIYPKPDLEKDLQSSDKEAIYTSFRKEKHYNVPKVF